MPAPRQGDCKVGGDKGFSNAAFASRDWNDGSGLSHGNCRVSLTSPSEGIPRLDWRYVALFIFHDCAEWGTGEFQTDRFIEFPEKSVAGERIDVSVNVGKDGFLFPWWFGFCGMILFSLTCGIGINFVHAHS